MYFKPSGGLLIPNIMQMIHNIILCCLGKKEVCVQYRRNFKKIFNMHLIDIEATVWHLDILNILIIEYSNYLSY